MNVVGFDVGKDSLFGARIDRSGVVRERFELPNTRKTIEPVLIQLRTKYKHLLVASEATAEYHRPLAELCVELGISFRMLNPITTKQFVRTTVRKKKTDVTDAEAIALVALQGGGTVVTKGSFRDVQPMMRTSVKLVQMGQMLTLMQQHVKSVLPEETALLKELKDCRERLVEASDKFRERASGQTPEGLSQLLQSIPGIGPVTATTLIAEIGDITRFKDAEALVAYAGLDPRVRQSGRTLQRNTHLTKRGSPYLRRVLYIAAASAERCDTELKATFDKKRAEGKRYKEATVVAARRLTNRVYAVWKRGTKYEIRETA
jgi:transposase